MQPAHLKIVQGTPFNCVVRVTQRDEADVLVPMPLTGYSVRLQARPYVASSDILLELASSTSQIEIDEDAGEFTMHLTSDETAALVWGKPHTVAKAVFHCEITPPDGETIRVLEGTLRLNPEVVR